MPISEDDVREALKQVVDPELYVNVVDLGLVYSVQIEETGENTSNVAIEMTLTSPMCPAGPQILGQSKAVIERLDHVGEVNVQFVMSPPWTPDRMTEEGKDQVGFF